MINRKYELYKSPYIRKADYKYYGTNNIMIDYILALIPIILIGWYHNGYKVYLTNNSIYSLLFPLIFVIAGGLFSYVIEIIYYYFKNRKENNIYEIIYQSLTSYSMIPGILLSLILPLNTPIWVLFIGCFFATYFGKLIYGGFGNNIFNPALVGYIFVISAFYKVINKNNSDIITFPTLLSNLNNILNNKITIEQVIKQEKLINIIFGLHNGCLAQTNNIACLISFIYLIIRKVINYKIPLITFLSLFISTFIIGIFININPLLFSIYNLFSGGIIFGTIFMVTEPVTSPRSVYGKYIYCMFIGLLTIFLRLLSDMKDGVATAILFMNMFSIILDNVCSKIRVENNILTKIKKIIVFILIYLFLLIYTILKINFKNI